MNKVWITGYTKWPIQSQKKSTPVPYQWNTLRHSTYITSVVCVLRALFIPTQSLGYFEPLWCFGSIGVVVALQAEVAGKEMPKRKTKLAQLLKCNNKRLCTRHPTTWGLHNDVVDTHHSKVNAE